MHGLRRKTWENVGVAMIAAYMLILQGLLGAFATGVANAATDLDAFGNPLCITSGELASVDADGSHDQTLPDCCSAACSMFSTVTNDDHAPHALDNPLRVGVDATAATAAAACLGFALKRGPGSPRSPPLTA